MNNLDKQYLALMQDVLENGVRKADRTGTGTLSVFGRQIRHKMSDGFPLLTTKKMFFKGIATELIWFLRGDTNIKYLVDNGCHIWDGDAYKRYADSHTTYKDGWAHTQPIEHSKESFIEAIKTDSEFAKKWGELGPIYGKQWRRWDQYTDVCADNGYENGSYDGSWTFKQIDQIANLINDLKTNPDSRRLMVSAWNVGEIDSMVLPPCHYGFQVWTRELSFNHRYRLGNYQPYNIEGKVEYENGLNYITQEQFERFHNSEMDKLNIPTRAISLMWNQRSVDTMLGLPFDITSYGLLLELIAKEVNMIPEELIGSLGDTHLYLNHLDQAREQISREPFELPKLKFDGWLGAMTDDQIREEGLFNLIQTKILPSNFQIENYQSHPAIKAPLSN